MNPLPPGFRVVLDSSARSHRGGRVLVGGSPPRVLRLTAAGAAAVAALRAGRDVPAAARGLGRRLVDAGVAHPRPPRAAGPPDVTVVIPVRDRARALGRCLAALDASTPVVVVDDGSADPSCVAAVCRAHGATLVRHERAEGPAAARNTGLRLVETELVAFLDSDCVPAPGWLTLAGDHFADGLVGAVAPRVRPPEPGRRAGVRERFAAARSPIDMGADEGRVVPGGRVPYVPSAALVVRRRALAEPFDPELRHGEDVDLVWRLHDAGWHVRYEPAATVWHSEPSAWRGLLRRRRRYGTSAAPLSKRHPKRLAPVVSRPWPTAAAALLLAGRGAPALVVAALQAATIARRTRGLGVPAGQSVLWSAGAVGQTILGLGRAGTTLCTPALLAALLARRCRRGAFVLLTAPPLVDWVRRRPRLDPLRWTLACIADDVAYGTGVWQGCLRHRQLAPLLPTARPPTDC